MKLKGYEPKAQEHLIDDGTRYRVKEEFIPLWYGDAETDFIEEKQIEGFSINEIQFLANGWAESTEDLMNDLEVIE